MWTSWDIWQETILTIHCLKQIAIFVLNINKVKFALILPSSALHWLVTIISGDWNWSPFSLFSPSPLFRHYLSCIYIIVHSHLRKRYKNSVHIKCIIVSMTSIDLVTIVISTDFECWCWYWRIWVINLTSVFTRWECRVIMSVVATGLSGVVMWL